MGAPAVACGVHDHHAILVAPWDQRLACVRAGTTGAAAAGTAAGRSSKAGARLPIGVGTSLGASSLVLFAVSCFLWRRKRRHTGGPSSLLGIHGTQLRIHEQPAAGIRQQRHVPVTNVP